MKLQRPWACSKRRPGSGAKRRRACWIISSPACRPAAAVRTCWPETTVGKLTEAIESDLVLKSKVRNTGQAAGSGPAVAARAMEIIRLNKGLDGIPPGHEDPSAEERNGAASPMRTSPRSIFITRARFCKSTSWRNSPSAASLPSGTRCAWPRTISVRSKEANFLARWLPGRDKEIGRQTTPESWRAIVESLGNPVPAADCCR